MPSISTSFVVQFSPESTGGPSSILRAEIDAFDGGLNGGKTSFIPGDSPVFLVYKSSNVTIDSITVSLGSAASLGQVTTPEKIEEDISFIDSDTANTSYPVHSGFESKWIGNALGAANLVGDSLVRANAKGDAILKVKYYSRPNAYRITGIPNEYDGETTFSTLVVVRGTST